MIRSSFWRRLRVALMAGLVVGGSAAAMAYWRPLEAPELWVYDALAQRTAGERRTDEPVVVVGIDDASIERVRLATDLGWPWPREIVGRGVEEMARLGARLVVLDEPFHDASPAGADDEIAFVRHLRAAGNAVVAARVTEQEELGQLPRGRWAARIGSYWHEAEALRLAADLAAHGQRSYLVPAGEQVELWAGGVRSRAEVEQRVLALAQRLGIQPTSPEIRELSPVEMAGAVAAADWVSSRDAIAAPGADALAVPSYDAWLLPRPEVAAAAKAVGLLPDAARAPREGLESLSDVFEVKDDDFDLPRRDRARAVRLFIRKGGRLYPSLALASLLALEPLPLSVQGGRFHYGQRSVPVNRRGFIYVTYPKASAFAAAGGDAGEIPFAAFLDSAQRRAQHLPPSAELERAVKDKIVVVAGVASAARDSQATLIPQMPYRAAVVASALRTLLDGSAVGRASRGRDAAWALAMGLFGALFAFAAFRTTRSTLVNLLVGGGGLLAMLGLYALNALRLFEGDRVWLAAFWPCAACLGAALVTRWINHGEETHDRARVIDALGRLAGRALVNRVLADPALVAPERRQLTFCFVELADFAGIAETLPARRLSELLSLYLAAVTEAVLDARGHLDTFMGEAVIAFWGAPFREERQAELACRAALQMRERLEKLRPRLQREFGVEVRARAGLHSGEAVVGALGAAGHKGQTKVHYTAVGVAVGVAAQLREANGAYGTPILVGEAVAARVGGAFELREIDSVRVKNAEQPMRVFELQAERGKLTGEQVRCNQHYARGLEAYRRRDFAGAREHFAAALHAVVDDGPSRVLLARCERFREAPPPDGWDGCHPLTSP